MYITQYRRCPSCGHNTGKFLRVVKSFNFLKCQNCTLVYVDADPKAILDFNKYEEKVFFQYLFVTTTSTMAYYDGILDKVVKHFGRKDIRILDFGCGAGFFLRRAKIKNIPAVGVDFSPYSELAKKYFQLDIEISDIFESSFPPNSFDVIFSHGVHEHLDQMDKITQKLHSLLKLGGILILSALPNYSTLTIHIFNNFFNNYPPGHINFFTTGSMSKFLKLMKFEPMKVKTYGIDFLWPLVYKLQNIKAKILGKKKDEEVKDIDISNVNMEDIKVKPFHHLLVSIYNVFHLPNMGHHVEAWAIKKENLE